MNEEKQIVCTWTERENGKGDIYIPSCLGKSSKGVNIWKVCKKYNVTPIQIFKSCPFCGNNVVINAVKVPEKNK